MSETAYQRYFRCREQELPVLRKALDDCAQEIEDELHKAQAECNPHKDDGGWIEGSCTQCGKLLG